MRLPPGFESAWVLGFLGARAVPGLEECSGDSYGRVMFTEGRHHWLNAQFGTGHLLLGSPTLPAAARRRFATQLFGLDTDLAPFQQMARRDAVLGPLVRRRPGLRQPRLLDPFEAVVRAVAGQLISVAAATTLVGRLTARFGERMPGGRTAFPAPVMLHRAERAIRGLGFPRTKARAIVVTAAAVLNGELNWPALSADSGLADQTLRRIPGIGPWTSAYVRWRALGDLDAFPAGDLGIIQAMAKRGIRASEVAARAEPWRPWRGLAIPHLWASLTE